MANTYTLDNIRLRVRQKADMVNSDFVTDPELDSYINESYAELYDIITRSFEDYNLNDTDLIISTGDDEVALPTDFYKLVGVDRYDGSTDYYPLKKFNWSKRNANSGGRYLRAVYGSYDVRYRIMGDNLKINPREQAPATYKLWYIPLFTPLVDDADTVNGYNGWEYYIVLDAAIKCLDKEESSTTKLERKKKELLERIEEMAANRDADQPETVQDVNRGYYDDDDGDIW